MLTLEKPTGKDDSYPTSIFDLLIQNKLSTLVLVDDNVSGLLQASKISAENKIKLVFGVRISVTDDAEEKNEGTLRKFAKYIIFVKRPSGYKKLIKIWSFAAKNGFYYEPRIDFKTLKQFWSDEDFSLAVPFYDSFLYLNSFESHIHVPELSFTKPVFLLENNNLPFDDLLAKKVEAFAKQNKAPVLPAQSIFYKDREDFLAYMAARCIHNRSTLEKPELSHMNSDQFNFEKWTESL